MKTTIHFLQKKILLIGMLCMLQSIAFAQTAVYVTTVDGEVEEYVVESDGKLWFSGNNLAIKDDEIGDILIPLSEIKKLTFQWNGGTIGVDDVAVNKDNILIFPNPAISYFELKSSSEITLNVRIYNTNGGLVLSGVYYNGSKVDVSNFASGIYVVVVNNQSFRLIKQ